MRSPFSRVKALRFGLINNFVTSCSKFGFVLLWFCALIGGVQASDSLFVSTNVPDSMNVCIESQTFTVTITNNHNRTMSGVVVNPRMPQGLIYDSSSVSGATEFDIRVANEPLFSLPTIGPGQTVLFSYDAHADCEILNQLPNTYLYHNTLVSYNAGPDSLIAVEVNPESYNYTYADVAIFGISPQQGFANIGDTLTRKITIVNGGTGCTENLTVYDVFEPGVRPIGINFGTLTLSGDTAIIKLNKADIFALTGDSLICRNDYVELQEDLILMDCSGGQSSIFAGWGCGDQICQDDLDFASLRPYSDSPAITINCPVTNFPTNFCLGDTFSVSNIYTNTGVQVGPGNGGVARLDYVEIHTSGANVFNYRLNGVPISTLGLNIVVIGGVPRIELDSVLTTDPDGPGGIEDLDMDGFFDDLAVGDFFEISAEYSLVCGGTNSCPAAFSFDPFQTTLYFRDQCEAQNNEMGPHGPSYSGGPQGGAINVALDTVCTGDNPSYSFSQDWALGGSLTCSNPSFYAEFTLPTGVSLISTTAYIDGNPVTATVAGATVTVPGGTFNSVYTIDVHADTITRGPNMIDLDWTQYFQCDASCGCVHQIGCATTQLVCPPFAAPPPPPCTSFASVDTVTAVRTSLGWDDQTLTQRISSTRPGIVLDKGLECDSLKVSTTASVGVNDMNNAHIRITYTLPGGVSILNLLGASVNITDSSTATSYACSLPAPTITADYFEWNLSGCILSNLPGGVITKGDKVDLIATFAIGKTNAIPAGDYELGLTVTHHNGLADSTCNEKSASFTFINVEEYRRYFGTDVNCGPSTFGLELYPKASASNLDEFPNEFRHHHVMDTLVVALPAGFTYVPGSSTIDGGTTVTLPDPTISGNLLTYINPGSWPIRDLVSGEGISIQFDLDYDCNISNAAAVTYTASYSNHQYSGDSTNCIEFKRETFVQNLNRTSPDLTLAPVLDTKVGFEREISYDINFCNQNTSTSANTDFAWIAFENPTMDIVYRYVINTTTGDTLPMLSYGAGNIWAQVGDLDEGVCNNIRLVVNYTGCEGLIISNNIERIDVRAGWGCAFPTAPDQNFCTPEVNDTLWLYPKLANMQYVVVFPDSINYLCDPVPYEIHVQSSQVGNIYDLEVGFTLPPQGGLTYVNGSAEFLYPHSGTYVSIPDPVNTSGTHYEWEVNSLDSIINADGLIGIRDTTMNRFVIRMELTTSCDFASGDVLRFQVGSITNCNDTIMQMLQTDPQFIEGLRDSVYYSTLHVTSDDFVSCDSSSTIHIGMVNDGPASTGSQDSISFTLPPNTQFGGGFTSIHNAPLPASLTTTTLMGGETQLSWQVPAGIALGDSMVFEFELGRTGSLACGDLELIVESTTFDSAVCAANSDTCRIDFVSGREEVIIHVRKPEVVLSNVEATTCGDSLNVSFMLTNTGTLSLASGSLTADFYCDSDNSGSISTGDALIASRTYPNSLMITQSAVLMDTIGYCRYGSRLIVSINSTAQCLCEGPAVLVTPDTLAPNPNISVDIPQGCDVLPLTFTAAPCVYYYDFSGTVPSPGRVTYSGGGVSQLDSLILDNTTAGWDVAASGANAFARTPGLAFEAKVRPEAGTQSRFGWFNAFPFNDYRGLVYSIEFDNGNLRIYEYGTLEANVGTYNAGQAYEIRIVLNDPGATYFIRPAGSSTWNQIHTSNLYTISPLTPTAAHFTAGARTFSDDWTVCGEEQLGLSHTWDMGDGNTVTGTAAFAYEYAQPGVYNVIHTISSICGDQSDTLEVLGQPTPVVTIDPAGPFCVQTTINLPLTASPVGGTWSGTGIVDSVFGLFNPSVAGGGLHPVVYCYTDSLGCTGCDTFLVDVSQFQLTSTVTNTSCFGGTDGAIDLTVTGGVAPFSYLWIPGFQSVEDPVGLSANFYSVLVSDATGCQNTHTTQVTQPTEIAIPYVAMEPNCFGGNDGFINIFPFGGTPPYNYLWLPIGNTTQNVNNLPAGNYVIAITDSNGCVGSESITLGQPNEMMLDTLVSRPVCGGDSSGFIDLTVTGGVPPYTYSWLPGGETSEDLIGLPQGAYDVLVTDLTGCSKSLRVNIGVPPSMQPTVAATDPTCPGASDGSIDLEITGGTAPFTYQWNPGGTSTQDLTGLNGGNYTATVVDGHGCIGNVSVSLTEAPAMNMSFTTIDPNCGLLDGSITMSVSGGTPGYTYLWSPGGQTTQNLTNLAGGMYTITTTDQSGCAFSDSVSLAIASPPGALISCCSDTIIGCFDSAYVSIDLVGPAPWTFTWTDGVNVNQVTTSASPYVIAVSPGESRTYEVLNVTSGVTTCPGEVCGAMTVAVDGPCPPCPIIQDFNTDSLGNPIPAGTKLSEQLAYLGIHISVVNDRNNHPDVGIIFNSSNPTGGDTDLGTPNQAFGGPGIGNAGSNGAGTNDRSLGNLLIIAEDTVDANNDGLVDDPDDEAGGGTISFTFDQPGRVDSLLFVDLDVVNPASFITTYHIDGSFTTTVIPSLGDNAVDFVPINDDSVVAMDVHFSNSGALAEIFYCPDCDDLCTQVDVTDVDTVNDCERVTLQFSCLSPCSSAPLTFIDVSIPCGTPANITNSAGLTTQLINRDPVSGLTGIRIFDPPACANSPGTFTLTYDVCDDTTACNPGFCAPIVALRNTMCLRYVDPGELIAPRPVAPFTEVTEMPKTPKVGFCEYLNVYPNPFSEAATFGFCLPQSGFTTIDLYNMEGQVLGRLYEGMIERHHPTEVPFDGKKLSKGVYVIKLETDSGVLLTRKMVIQ